MKIVKDGRIIEPGPGCKKLNPHLYKQSDVSSLGSIVKSPGKRIRQSTKPKSNALETAFGSYLKCVHGISIALWEQSITFRIANGCKYTPDWVALLPAISGSQIHCFEVKGKHSWDDSIVKLKVSASTYPQFIWWLCSCNNGVWYQEQVRP